MNQASSLLLGSALIGTIVGISWGLAFGPIVGIIAGIIGFGLSFFTGALAPKQTYNPPKPHKLDDFEIPTVTRFSCIPSIYGETLVSSHYIWYGNLSSEEVTESVDIGKGGSSEQDITVGYKYYCDVFLLYCQEPITIVKGPLNKDLKEIEYEDIILLNYGKNKEEIYNNLPNVVKEKTFPWEHFFTCYIKQCYLGENINIFPAIYFLVRDAIFENQEDEILKNNSYIYLPIDNSINFINYIRCVNPISFLLCILTEFLYGNKLYCSKLLNSKIIDTSRWKKLITFFKEHFLAINCKIDKDIESKNIINKVLFILGLKIDIIEDDDSPIKLTILNIADEKRDNSFDYTDENNKINCSETILDDFINFSLSYKKDIPNAIYVNVGYSLNKTTQIYYQITNNRFNKIENLDFSEFYYTVELNYILDIRLKNLYNTKLIKATIPIHKIDKLTSGTFVTIKYEPLNYTQLCQIEEMIIRNDENIELTLRESIF